MSGEHHPHNRSLLKPAFRQFFFGLAPGNIGEASRFASSAGETFGLSAEQQDDLALVVGETVSNSFIHGHSGVLLSVAAGTGSIVWLQVFDRSQALPPMPTTADLDAESGRGLMICDALAPGWHVTRLDDGKVFCFPFPRNADAVHTTPRPGALRHRSAA
ncbi:ATP-binding protein [Kitasatospora purpeofusca]|uniref:ATP-binding protein n=1 Tax=Kitasatospora purpeofusca TaxID=67352 RepID=UPI0036A01415